MQRLIALHGPAGSGKSYAANILVSEFGFTRMKFAATGKAMICTLLTSAGVPEREHLRYIEGDLKETPTPIFEGKSPRYAMQTMCTEWGRDCIGPDLWVNVTMRGVLDTLAQGYDVVLDDCRFDNEALEVIKLGGQVAKIRPTWPEWPAQQAARLGTALDPSHPSERGLRAYSAIIPNCGEHTGFRKELMEVLGL